MGAKTPSVRNASIRVLSGFFTWAVKAHLASSNPMELISKARTEKPKRTVLTLEQIRALLDECIAFNPSAIPYFAVGLFASVRPFEALRLKASDFKNGYIALSATVTKTASERTVAIRPNLARWLAAYPIGEEGIYPADAPYSLEWTTRHLFKKMGIADRKDILRHSFASYAYEESGDAARTAAELGHTTTSMLFKHYRGLVPPKSGKEYFSIAPLFD